MFSIVKNLCFEYKLRTGELNEERLSNEKWKIGLLAEPKYYQPAEIDAIFGVDVWLQILAPNLVKDNHELALEQETKLGYLILQREDVSNHPQKFQYHQYSVY